MHKNGKLAFDPVWFKGESDEQKAWRHDPPPCAVQVGAMNEVVFGVGPVKLLQDVVQRETVGPVDLRVDDHGSIGAVHTCPLDLRDLPPVCPVHVPNVRREKTGGDLVEIKWAVLCCISWQ